MHQLRLGYVALAWLRTHRSAAVKHHLAKSVALLVNSHLSNLPATAAGEECGSMWGRLLPVYWHNGAVYVYSVRWLKSMLHHQVR